MFALNKAVTGMLITSLIVSPALGQEHQSKAESERQQQCVRALEKLRPRNQIQPASAMPSSASNVALPVRLLDLSETKESEISEKIRRASRSDVLIVSDAILTNVSARKAIESSPSLFSMKAQKTTMKEIEDTLRLPVFQPEIVVALPVDGKGVHNAFGTPEDVAAPQVEYLNKVMLGFRRLKGVALAAAARTGSSIADSIMRDAERADAHNLFVLVAHNRHGMLHFPDRSSLSIAKVYETLERRHRPGLILSCDTIHSSDIPTSAVLTNTPLDIASIATALDKMQTGIARIESPVVADVLRFLGDSLYETPRDIGPRIKALVYVAGGLILVFGAMYFWKCDVDDKCKN